MILWDYDAAPDGCDTYVKLNTQFPSVAEALRYRDIQLRGMYWGHIETLDGKTILNLEEEGAEYDWTEHESRCDGCSFCNPTAFRDED
jgi:hypothetical protein